MNKYTMKVFTGPVAVKEIAERVRSKGYEVVEGAEHIYLEVEAKDATDAKVKTNLLCFKQWYEAENKNIPEDERGPAIEDPNWLTSKIKDIPKDEGPLPEFSSGISVLKENGKSI